MSTYGYANPLIDYELDRNSVSIRSFTHQGKRSCPIMASEYSILTDIAAELGIYRLNRESSPKSILENITIEKRKPCSVHEEAELLMNFKTTTSSPEPTDTSILNTSKYAKSSYKKVKTPDCQPSTISPSFSFEASKTEEDRFPLVMRMNRSSFTSRLQPMLQHLQCSDSQDTFILHCPSLSLNNDSNPVSVNAPSNLTPSYLFSRPIKTQPINMCSRDLSGIADSLATNVLESFNAAMNWQTKTWIKALSRVLSVRYELNKTKFLKKRGRRPKGSDLESIKEELKKSNEARVINSLSKASATVFIHDVRTTFSVLEQQLNAQDDSKGEEKKDSEMPVLKRRRQVSSDSSESSVVDGTPYVLSHAIILDARCSVSTSRMKKMSISFRTPGAMHGTFIRDSNGNAQLKKVRISLDTEALASSIDEKCRRVMRSASEECMVNPPVNYCTIYDTVQEQAMATEKVSCDDSHCTPEPQENLDSQRFYSDRRYESYFYSSTAEVESAGALVTPTLTTFMLEAAAIPFKMPQVPSRNLPFEGEYGKNIFSKFLNPRRVSPTEQCNGSGPFDSPTLTKITVLPNSKQFANTDLLVPPSLVSPSIPNRDEFVAENAPTMPALLEVARAAHAECH